MKKVASLLAAFTIATSLTGCSLLGHTVSMVGISGEDLTTVTYEAELASDDKKMLSVCQQLNGYTEGTIVNWGADDEKLGKSDQKQALRDVADDLDSAKDDFPEFNIYYDGVVAELASPGSNPDGFRQLVGVCETYDAVITSLKTNYAEPVIVTPGCWSSSNPSATLLEKVGEDFEQIDYGYSLYEDETLCTDPDFPYTYELEIPTSLAAVDTRTFKISLYSSNSFTTNNSTTVDSEEFSYDPLVDTSPLLSPAWDW